MRNDISHKIWRALFLVLCIISLSACDNTYHLEAQVKDLQAQLQAKDDFIQKQQYFIEVNQKEAAIAQACDVVIAMCPASVTAQGHEAIQAGYSGGSSALYWLIVAAKAIVAGALIASFCTVAWFLYFKIVSPRLDDIIKNETLIASAKETAEKILADARHQADAAIEDAFSTTRDIHARAEKSKSQLHNLEAQVHHIQEELKPLIQARDHARQELEAIQAARNALDSF